MNKVSISVITIILAALAVFLYVSVGDKQTILLLIGAGLGITLMHSAFGFSGAWRAFIRSGRNDGVRAQIILLAATAILFFPIIGKLFPGIVVAGATAQFGVSVFVGAFLFGIGMQLGGGCGSGTLYTVGQGQVDMVITLIFFMVGATIGSAHLGWWTQLPNLGNVSMIKSLGWPIALTVTLVSLGILYGVVSWIGKIRGANARGSRKHRWHLIRGPWPLWGGVLGLALLNLATLLTAKHPWSITFAFSLWGSKIWQAVGGNSATWPAWQPKAAATALNNSVLLDTTSVMNFGIILGAGLAAALAGKFTPEDRYKPVRLVTAILGGLLLGYGARLGFGCNIGALLGGVASGSLHAWAWLAAAFLGGITGTYVRIWMGIDRPIRHEKA
jgi:uncharacterized membrane protein YedE/YeeE